MTVSDPGNEVASGSSRYPGCVSGRFRCWSWRKEVELWGWLWVGSGIRAFKVLMEGLPKPQPIGEGTFGFCSSALMSLVSGFAATT